MCVEIRNIYNDINSLGRKKYGLGKVILIIICLFKNYYIIRLNGNVIGRIKVWIVFKYVILLILCGFYMIWFLNLLKLKYTINF